MNNYSMGGNVGNEGMYRGNATSYMTPYSSVKLINTYGLSIPFLESLGIYGPLVSKVFVANIDYFVDNKMLEEVFSLAGKVLNVEILNQDGKSRGMAIIEYAHPFEAVQAISLFHNQLYYDRRITVRMDRNAEKEMSRPEDVKLPLGLKSVGLGLGVNGAPQRDLSNLPNTLAPISNVPWNRAGCSGSGGMYQGLGESMGDMSGMQREINGIASNLSMRNTVDMGQMNESRMGYSHNNQNAGMSSGAYNNTNYSHYNQSMSQGNGNSISQVQQPSNCVIQVNNIPFDFTWQNLRDLCKPFGEVRFSEIVGRGSGKVRFSYEVNARKAAESLCHRMIEGRPIEARVI